MGRLEQLLFEDLRVDTSVFNQLDLEALVFLAERYKATTLGTFVKFARKRSHA
jgi:hypothetical protein